MMSVNRFLKARFAANITSAFQWKMHNSSRRQGLGPIILFLRGRGVWLHSYPNAPREMLFATVSSWQTWMFFFLAKLLHSDSCRRQKRLKSNNPSMWYVSTWYNLNLILTVSEMDTNMGTSAILSLKLTPDSSIKGLSELFQCQPVQSFYLLVSVTMQTSLINRDFVS